MSVWAEGTISVSLEKYSGCSIKTIFYERLESVIIRSFTQNEISANRILITSEFAFIDSGAHAASVVEQVLSDIKEFDKTAYIDCTVSIRFLK